MPKHLIPETAKGKRLAKVVMAPMFALFLYGLFRFPVPPYEPCGDDKFCDKRGQAVSERDYEASKNWETAMFIVWPLGFLIVWGICLAEKSQREK